MRTTLVVEMTERQLKALSYLYAVKQAPSVESNVEMMRNPDAFPVNKEHASAVVNHIVHTGLLQAEQAYMADIRNYENQQVFVAEIANKR